MLSPLILEATGPALSRAARTMRVVVDLPFVPVTMTEEKGGGQFGQELWGDAQSDLSANHASGSSAEGPGSEAGGSAGHVGHARAHRQVMR